MPINSRQKGADFELEIADVLSQWWGEKVRRTPMSGGWSAEATSGDITPVGPMREKFPWSVECKKTEDWSFTDLLKLSEAMNGVYLHEHWLQCVRDCSKYNHNNPNTQRNPVLIFSANRQPKWVMLEYEYFGEIFEGDQPASLLWPYLGSVKIILKLEEFLKGTSAAQFK